VSATSRWAASTCGATSIPAAGICRCSTRSHIVAASVAAGLAPPIDSAYANVADSDGLRAPARHARSLGFLGKSAIHPRQIPVLHDVSSPDDDEVAWARAVIDAVDRSRTSEHGERSPARRRDRRGS
jgi:citrate lyase beta subunit